MQQTIITCDRCASEIPKDELWSVFIGYKSGYWHTGTVGNSRTLEICQRCAEQLQFRTGPANPPPPVLSPVDKLYNAFTEFVGTLLEDQA